MEAKVDKQSTVKSNHFNRQLKHWPSEERPREKLLSKGAKSLSDAELLAIFLRTGVKGCNVVELSRRLLQQFGSLHALFKADMTVFCQQQGLGSAKFVQLQACLEMSRRYLFEQIEQKEQLTSSSSTRQYLLSELKRETNEVFALLLLDNQHQVIRFERLFYGTIDAAAVYPRVVVEKCLQYQAVAVILAHNHPSGIAEASLADRQITQRLIKALALVDIRVLDHIIIAGHLTCSLAEMGEI
jgi:DNA repair protein RadC